MSGNGISFWSVSETKFCFGVTRKQISVSWCFFVHMYSRKTVEVETRSLSESSCYITRCHTAMLSELVVVVVHCILMGQRWTVYVVSGVAVRHIGARGACLFSILMC